MISELQKQPATVCVHHWRIAAPDDATCRGKQLAGVCQKCNAQRYFPRDSYASRCRPSGRFRAPK